MSVAYLVAVFVFSELKLLVFSNFRVLELNVNDFDSP